MQTDIGITTFADDLQRKICAKTAAELAEKATTMNELDESLRSGGKYKQNRDKQMWQPTLVGHGSSSEIKHLLALQGGGCDPVPRYLGNLLHSRGGLVAERERRLKAARQDFYEMGKFWWVKTP